MRRNKKYYEKMGQSSVTKYDFAPGETGWLAYVDSKGNLKSSIPYLAASTISKMTPEEYLIDMLDKGFLCGLAEEVAEKMKRSAESLK